MGWRRWVDGWGAGLVVLLVAGSALLLTWPRSVPPMHLPQPVVDRHALAAVEAEDDRRAIAAGTPLDVDVRAVGTLIRRYDEAAADGDEAAVIHTRGELVTVVGKALTRHGAEPLRILRAYQMHRFLAALRTWTESGEVTEELRAVGGDFVAAMDRQRWCRGGPRRLIASDSVLRALFKKRWNDVTGLAGPEFDLSLDEDRVRFGFLLAHPFRIRSSALETSPAADGAHLARSRLTTIDRLAALDPTYPTFFARGVVLYQMGKFEDAAEAFRRYLGSPDDAPYRLWAQNHLRACVDRMLPP